MTQSEVNIKMNQISFRNIYISGIASFLIAIILISRGSTIGIIGALMFILFYLVIGIAMVSIAVERDHIPTIEERILGSGEKNLYDINLTHKKMLHLLFIAVLALNWLGVYLSGGPIFLTFINLVIVSVFMLIIGAASGISIKYWSRLQGIGPANVVFVFATSMMMMGAGVFYSILFSSNIETGLSILPMFAISAGVFTAVELVILNGLNKVSIWKNMIGLVAHLIFPAGVMFALVLDYELSNNLDGVTLGFWVDNYMRVANTYLSYLVPGLLVGSISAFITRRIIRD